jgi:hypothetical protein
MTTAKNPGTASSAPPGRRRRVLLIVLAAFALLVAAVIGFAVVRGPAHASQINCAPNPSKCGFPDASNSGVQSATTLQAVPGKVTSGTGWTWNASTKTVQVTTAGANISGLNISGSLDISANNVTVNGVQVTSDGGDFGISLRHTTGVTVENSTIAGSNSTDGRIGVGITDVSGDSTGMIIKGNDISNFKTAIQVSTGQITGNYIHNPGFVAGDHTNGILDVGTTQPLTISHNTILNNLGQTDAISLDATGSGQTISNKTVSNNLLAGGGYAIYGGTTNGNTVSNIVITGNDFSQAFYPTSGQYGPVAYFSSTASGDTWSGNVYDTSGKTIPAP